MARIRSVHPGFFTDEAVVSVSPIARICVIGLGIEADDKGIFEWKPLTLKMRLFPADNVAIDDILNELEAANLVRKYEIEGRQYGAIRNFRKFQRPKTPNDVHPMPDEIGNYVGLSDAVSEKKKVKHAPFPQKGEKLPQMEDGGWRMEDGNNEAKASKAKFVLPDWVNSEAWDGYVAMRKKIGKAMTDRAKVLAIGKLEAFRSEGHDPAKVLDQSTAASWQGLFAVRGEYDGKRGNTQQRNHSAPPQHNPLVRAVIAEREARTAGDGYGQSGGGSGDGASAWRVRQPAGT